MFGRKLKIIVALLAVILTTSSLFALEEYVSDVYKQIDDCFASQDDVKLNKIRSDNNRDKY